MSKISGDPFVIEGSQQLNREGKGVTMNVDGFSDAGAGAFIKASGGSKPKEWNKELIVQEYKGLLTNVDSLKTAINSKNVVAARTAAAKIKKSAEAIDKLVK